MDLLYNVLIKGVEAYSLSGSYSGHLRRSGCLIPHQSRSLSSPPSGVITPKFCVSVNPTKTQQDRETGYSMERKTISDSLSRGATAIAASENEGTIVDDTMNSDWSMVRQ